MLQTQLIKLNLSQMKKRNLFSSIAKTVTVSALMVGGTVVFNSCEKEDPLTEIKIEDSEDVQGKEEAIGVEKLKQEFAEMDQARKDSLNHILEKLQKDHDIAMDALETGNDEAIKLALHELDVEYKEGENAIELEKLAQELMKEIHETRVDSAQMAVDLADKALEISKLQTDQEAQIATSAQVLATKLAEEKAITYGELLTLQQSMYDLTSDSVTKSYEILETVSGKKQDSIQAGYDLLAAVSMKLNDFVSDTAADNSAHVVEMDKIAKDEEVDLDKNELDQILELLNQANQYFEDIQVATYTAEVLVIQMELDAKKAVDAAQKELDDYLENQTAIAAEEKTELTIKVFSMDPMGNETLLASGATITLNGAELTENVVIGDLEGDHYISVAAEGHLTTQFAFNIADDADNDDADGFELYEQTLTIKLLQATETFTVQGKVKGNTLIHTLYDPTVSYGFLYKVDSYEAIPNTTEMYTNVMNSIAKKEQEQGGTDEAISGVNLSVKVSSDVDEADYLDYTAGISVSSFNMVYNATALSATTGADGMYEIAGVPVLNDDFTVEVAIANFILTQQEKLYARDNSGTTAVLHQDEIMDVQTKTIQNQMTEIDPTNRESDIVWFIDFDLL